MRLWEPGITLKKDLKTSYDYGIVLSGMLTYDKKNETINFGTATDRILQTLELYKEGYIEKIFISGGSGEVFNQEFKESLILKELLITLDIPENDIIIDLKSRNTYENAIETAKILNPKENNSTYLLITSGFHMRRATGCYKKQGFDFDIYTTDNYSQSRLFTPDMLIVPQPLALSGWTLLIHEITGFIVYKIAGYC
jgi:uncharacterized SAM-binding protein YcdF (DUF218 family)